MNPVFPRPDGGKFSYQLANCKFTAQGESAEGADKGAAYTHYVATISAMGKKPCRIYALSFCNFHGMWENRKEIKVASEL